MARSKLTETPDSNIPINILKRNFEENSLDNNLTKEDNPCSHIAESSQICQPSTSSGVTKREEFDFDLINIVKDDLKQNIHKRRHQKGLGAIELDKDDYPRIYQVSLSLVCPCIGTPGSWILITKEE